MVSSLYHYHGETNHHLRIGASAAGFRDLRQPLAVWGLACGDSGRPPASGGAAPGHTRSSPPIQTRAGNDRQRFRAAQVRGLRGRQRGIGDVCEQGLARRIAASPPRGGAETAGAAETAAKDFRLRRAGASFSESRNPPQPCLPGQPASAWICSRPHYGRRLRLAA